MCIEGSLLKHTLEVTIYSISTTIRMFSTAALIASFSIAARNNLFQQLQHYL